MKRLVLFLLLCIPCIIQAGIIVTKDNGNIEDVTSITIGNTEITYKQDGQLKSISRDDVSAVLHDNGRYEEIKSLAVSNNSSTNAADNFSATNMGITTPSTTHRNSSEATAGRDAKIYNIYAFGTHTGVAGYLPVDDCDDIRVEYRIIYKSRETAPPFQFLGVTPFAYVTEQAYNNPIIRTYEHMRRLMTVEPLIIEKAKDVQKVEFKLSKEGYKTIVIAPIKDVLMGGGLVMMLPLKKLKPLKEGEEDNVQDSHQKNNTKGDSQLAANTGNTIKAVDKETNRQEVEPAEKKMIPQICYTEGKNAYDATYKEGQIQAVRRGYSKTQAILIAGEFAEHAKRKAIDECYDRIVVRDEEVSSETNNTIDFTVSLFEVYELSASAKKIIPQACVDEGKNAYDATYAEAEAKALRQGYSKSQAKTVASDAAEKARQKAIDECYDKIVNKGEDYYSGGTVIPEEIKAQESKAKEDAKAREAEEKRLAEERKKQEADSIKNAKEAEKIAAKENKKQPKAKTEDESAENNRKMLLGLSIGTGVPIAQWYKYDGQERRDGESFGADIQASFDFAYPISKKFAMGLYVAGGGGLTFINELSKISGEKNMHSYNKSIMKATAGILMVMGDFVNKGAFLLGFGAGYADTGWHTIGDIIPIEVRLGGVFKNGFYFDFDLNMSPFNVTPYNDFYIEPAVRFGYNFGNLFTLKNKEK